MNATRRPAWRDWWDDLDRGRRVGLLAGIGMVVLAGSAFAWFSLRTDLVPLTGDMPKADVASVVAQLEDLHARYRVDADSGAVLVPAADLEPLRAQLAEKGWPLKLAAGFELFDNGDFGMTEFTEHINYQRALEGELSRTIMALDGIRYARVHLVLPQSTVFRKATESAKASVLLVVRRGVSLNEAQIGGIQSIVASAVPELKAEKVSVHDYRGVELSTGSAVSTARINADIRAESDVEDFLSAKAEEILTGIFGNGAATVSVEATLTRSHVSSVRDEILPAEQGVGAAPSTRSDSAPSKSGAPTKAVTASPQVDGEYRVGHLTEQAEVPPGGIQRLSVGVVIPDPSPQGLTTVQIRDLIAAAIGIDPRRGDRIAVYPVAAARIPPRLAVATAIPAAPAAPAAIPVAASADAPPTALALALAGGLILTLVLCGFLLRRGRREARLSDAERQEVLDQMRVWLQEGGH